MKLKPLGDKVVLQYHKVEEKTESGIILPDNAKKLSQEDEEEYKIVSQKDIVAIVE